MMAILFNSVFSSSLIVSKNDSEFCLPSPESLKGKIILKGKVALTPSSSDSDVWNEKTDSSFGSQENKNPSKSVSLLTHQIVYCRKIHFSGFPVNGNLCTINRQSINSTKCFHFQKSDRIR